MSKIKPVEEVVKEYQDYDHEVGWMIELATAEEMLKEDRQNIKDSLVEELETKAYNCDPDTNGTHYTNGYEQAIQDAIDYITKELT
jgi:hypothetical protein